MAPRSTTPRSATLCALAALAVGLAGCAGTPEPARTATVANRGSDTSTADALTRIAHHSLEAGDPASAVAMLKRAHAVNPNSAPILAELGHTLASLKAWQESAEAYRKAAELAPNDPAIRRGNAAALLALNLPSIAEQEYRAAAALHEDPSTLSGLGVALDLQGRHDEAMTAFHRALELDPDGVATRANLALSLALWGSSDEAIGLLAPIAASASADARQRQNLALVFGLAGDMEQARAVAKIDLGEEAVRNNLAYYETLRGLTPILRTRALMGNHAVTAAGTQITTSAANSAAAPPATPADAVQPKTAPTKPSRAAEAKPAKKSVEKAAVATIDNSAPKAAPSETSSRIATPESSKSVPATVPTAAASAPATSTPALDAPPALAPVADTRPVFDNPAESAAIEPSESKAEPVAVAVAPQLDPKIEPVTAATAKVSSNGTLLDDTAATESVAPQAVSEPNVAEPSVAGPSVVENAPTLVEDEKVAQPVPESSASAVDTAITTGAAEPAPQVAEQAHAETLVEVAPPVANAVAGQAPMVTPAIVEHEANLPADVLPPVTVRVGGVPLAQVPQHRLLQDVDANTTQASLPRPTTDVSATMNADESLIDGDATAGSVPAPTAEPMKRDRPTKLLPREHAAIEPLR